MSTSPVKLLAPERFKLAVPDLVRDAEPPIDAPLKSEGVMTAPQN
jgi:hypothetical protein